MKKAKTGSIEKILMSRKGIYDRPTGSSNGSGGNGTNNAGAANGNGTK